MLLGILSVRQVISVVCAFAVATVFSFYSHSRQLFMRHVRLTHSLMFIGFKAFLSVGTGWLGDGLNLPGVMTLVLFSSVSLVVWYFY